NPLIYQLLDGLPQGLIAGAGSEQAGEGVGVGAGEDGLAEGQVERGELGDGDAALVTVGGLAPKETLGKDAVKGAGDLVRLEAHVDQAVDGEGGGGGVEGAEEAVAGESGLEGKV